MSRIYALLGVKFSGLKMCKKMTNMRYDQVFSISLSPSFTIQRDGLQELEEGLDRSDFERKIEENKQKTKVHLEIPKFKIESEIPLKRILKSLGMTKTFKPGIADFRGVSNMPLYVSEVIEKALIEVDEILNILN